MQNLHGSVLMLCIRSAVERGETEAATALESLLFFYPDECKSRSAVRVTKFQLVTLKNSSLPVIDRGYMCAHTKKL